MHTNKGPPPRATLCTIDGTDERFFAVGALALFSTLSPPSAPRRADPRHGIFVTRRYWSLLSDRREARAVRLELSDGIRVLHRDADIVQPFHQTPPDVVIDLEVRR